MAKRGRPRIYASEKEKHKAYRESKKQGGAVYLGCYIPLEYKDLLKRFSQENNMTLGNAICYLLELQYGEEEGW